MRPGSVLAVLVIGSSYSLSLGFAVDGALGGGAGDLPGALHRLHRLLRGHTRPLHGGPGPRTSRRPRTPTSTAATRATGGATTTGTGGSTTASTGRFRATTTPGTGSGPGGPTTASTATASAATTSPGWT